jgi:outer membrane receptor protein involved in Fe transport
MSKSYWLLSAGLVALATPAYAQPQPPQPDDQSAPTESPTEEGSVDEATQDGTEPDIVVTAQGRRQILQDVPLAVSAVSGESLQNSGATDIRQLNQLAPSLLVSSTGSESNGSARIRGIGTVGDNPGLESSVAVFIDGVYRSRSGIGLNELGEIERIEVLRGPQGTLFGRNASAGLIHIISRRPEFEFGGSAELTYGNYDFMRGSVGLTGPLSDTIAFRLDAVAVRRDGFYDVVNAANGTEERVNNRNRIFTRGQLLFEPNDALSIRLIGDYTTRDESCCGATYIEMREAFDPTPGVPGDFTYRAGDSRIVSIMRQFGAIFPSAGDTYNREIAITPGQTYRNDTRDWGLSGQIDYDFGNVNFTSITAYRHYESEGAADIDYSNLDLLVRPADGNVFRRFNTFTQEVRFGGSAFGGMLDWLVGGYFATEDLLVADNTTFGSQYGPFAACRALAGSAQNPSPIVALLNPAAPGCLSSNPAAPLDGRRAFTGGLIQQLTAGGVPLAQAQGIANIFIQSFDRLSLVRNLGDNRANYHQDSTNWALFTHNIFNITDELKLTLGARYTHENKEFDANFDNDNTICPQQQAALGQFLTGPLAPALGATAGGIITLSCVGNSSSALNGLDLQHDFSESEWTGTAVVSYQPSDSTLLYGSYSRGYKAGGYNLDRSDLGSALFPRTNADAANLRFAPETVDAFELGAKYTRRNFTLNAALFHQRFNDFQLNTFNGTVFIVQNINGCSDLVGGSNTDQDQEGANAAGRGTCAAENVEHGVTSTGLELEGLIRPTRDLSLTLGYTYTRARYRDDLIGSSTGEALDPALFLLAGQNLSNAPEHVVTSSITYTPPIGSSGLSGLFYLDSRLTSDFNTGSDLFPEKAQDSFLLVNGRIGIRGPDQRWAIEFWAQNLLDTEYQQVAFNAPLQSSSPNNGTIAQVQRFGSPNSAISNQVFSSYLAEPRTFGITGRFRF